MEGEIRTLTSNQLRKYEGLESLTDEQAEEIAQTLKELTLITHELVMKEQKKSDF